MRNESDQSEMKMVASLWLSIKKKIIRFDEIKPLMSAGSYNSYLSSFFD